MSQTTNNNKRNKHGAAAAQENTPALRSNRMAGGGIGFIPNQAPASKPADDRLVTWTLVTDQQQEWVQSQIHKDGSSPESIVNPRDMRTPVDLEDFQDGGKYRSVVKIQSLWENDDGRMWTMGSGWLIREDLVVTAGHNVFSQKYGGQALRVKCWVGYRGANFANDTNVQHRNALNIVTTETWVRQQGNQKRHDVALIQVEAPFTGNLSLFKYINDPEDNGAWMYEGRRQMDYDLESAQDHMIEYKIDTFGGQSGAPVLLSEVTGMKGIGTHCYGAEEKSGFNLGNPINGTYGNKYDEFVKRLVKSSSTKPIPLGNFKPAFDPSQPLTAAPYRGQESGGDGGEESFWDVLKDIAKVGAKVLSVTGPVGKLVGAVAGGILGNLAESAVDETKKKAPICLPDRTTQLAYIQRAQVAEAALQSVLRLEPSRETEMLLGHMSTIWTRQHIWTLNGPQLRNLVSPVVYECGFRLAADQWQKSVSANPAAKHVQAGKNDVKLEKKPATQPNDPKSGFIDALFDSRTRSVEGVEKETEESLPQWLTGVLTNAVEVARPLTGEAAQEALNKIFAALAKARGNAEAAPMEDPEIDLLLQRSLVADCALQALETMSRKELDALRLVPGSGGAAGAAEDTEESFLDAVKTTVQKLGPKAIHIGWHAVLKHLPGILDNIAKAIDGSGHATIAGAASVSDAYEGDDRYGAWDDMENPDAPARELRAPAEPN